MTLPSKITAAHRALVRHIRLLPTGWFFACSSLVPGTMMTSVPWDRLNKVFLPDANRRASPVRGARCR